MTVVRRLCSSKCRDQAVSSNTQQRLSSFVEFLPELRRPSSNGTGYYIRLRCEVCDEPQWILFPGKM